MHPIQVFISMIDQVVTDLSRLTLEERQMTWIPPIGITVGCTRLVMFPGDPNLPMFNWRGSADYVATPGCFRHSGSSCAQRVSHVSSDK